MVTTDRITKGIERSTATLQLMNRVASYFPWLIRTYQNSTREVVTYRFGQLCGITLPKNAYAWVRGTRWVPSYCLYQLVHEILAVAEKERAELHQLREERRANAEAKGH